MLCGEKHVANNLDSVIGFVYEREGGRKEERRKEERRKKEEGKLVENETLTFYFVFRKSK